MSLYNTAKQYAAYATAYHTVNKTRQVIMLYEGVVKLIKQAKIAINEKRIEERYNLLEKASTILLGLQSSLDFEQGGEIAKLLQQYYTSMDFRIITVQRTNDLAICDQLIKELEMMKDAWEEVDSKVLNEGQADTKPAATASASNKDSSGSESSPSEFQVSV